MNDNKQTITLTFTFEGTHDELVKSAEHIRECMLWNDQDLEERFGDLELDVVISSSLGGDFWDEE